MLETKSLLLREFTEDDSAGAHAYASDPEVVKYMPWGPNTGEETRIFIEGALARQAENPRPAYDLAVVERESGRLIGGARLCITDAASRQGDLGYCLNRAFWGKGYGTEVAKALLELGFNRLHLHRIWATCDVNNKASVAVLEKVGLIKEGYLKEDLWQHGAWRSSYLLALREEQYNGPPNIFYDTAWASLP